MQIGTNCPRGSGMKERRGSEGSRSQEDEVRFRGLAEASFLSPVGFIVWNYDTG